MVIAKAPALRAAGVTSVELGEVKFTIAPPEPALAQLATGGADDPEPGDPLRDPYLYGMNRGTPGYGAPADDVD